MLFLGSIQIEIIMKWLDYGSKVEEALEDTILYDFFRKFYLNTRELSKILETILKDSTQILTQHK
jgi:hypothetical protein